MTVFGNGRQTSHFFHKAVTSCHIELFWWKISKNVNERAYQFFNVKTAKYLVMMFSGPNLWWNWKINCTISKSGLSSMLVQFNQVKPMKIFIWILEWIPFELQCLTFHATKNSYMLRNPAVVGIQQEIISPTLDLPRSSLLRSPRPWHCRYKSFPKFTGFN